jgi:hypothetical protein
MMAAASDMASSVKASGSGSVPLAQQAGKADKEANVVMIIVPFLSRLLLPI